MYCIYTVLVLRTTVHTMAFVESKNRETLGSTRGLKFMGQAPLDARADELTHCATAVAIAAPSTPRPQLNISSGSSTTFTTPITIALIKPAFGSPMPLPRKDTPKMGLGAATKKQQQNVVPLPIPILEENP